MFHPHLIKQRVHVNRGNINFVDATRALMHAALADPMNQKFVMLTESCIPLYSPLVLYAQLMSEAKSRVNACVFVGGEVCPCMPPSLRVAHQRYGLAWLRP